MAFERETLQSILDKTYSNYMSLLKPLDKTPRYNLMKVLAYTEGGDIHQLFLFSLSKYSPIQLRANI